jgi:beta-lactamase regulating signal transducer with metallopeptidase domain
MTIPDLNLMQSVAGVSRVVATLFVSGLWQGVVLAAGVGICLRLVPKTTATVRFAIWTILFAVLAVLPLMHAYSGSANGSVSGRAALMHVDVRWSFAIAALWLMVSLVRAVKLAMSAVRLHGIWKRATPVDGCDAVLLAAGFRGVELCTSKDVDRPSVIGFFSPRILIPEELFDRLTTAEFGQIVLHEVGHLRRRDDWINLLQKVSLVLVPLNPALMWIERQLCLERELACDDDVLRLTKAPKAYAMCLTNLAEKRLGRRAAALSLGAWEKHSELARRVQSILRGGEGMGRAQARVVMTVLVVALVGGATGLARCPEFVSFSPTVLPTFAATHSLTTASYQAVNYRTAGSPSREGVVPGAHEILLKASMPVNREHGAATSMDRPVSLDAVPTGKKAVVKHRIAKGTPVLQTRVSMPRRQRAEGWIVLTTWQEPVRRGVTFDADNYFPISYAAVPTAGGWLVIQL